MREVHAHAAGVRRKRERKLPAVRLSGFVFQLQLLTLLVCGPSVLSTCFELSIVRIDDKTMACAKRYLVRIGTPLQKQFKSRKTLDQADQQI